jgi:hypothetical protein
MMVSHAVEIIELNQKYIEELMMRIGVAVLLITLIMGCGQPTPVLTDATKSSPIDKKVETTVLGIGDIETGFKLELHLYLQSPVPNVFAEETRTRRGDLGKVDIEITPLHPESVYLLISLNRDIRLKGNVVAAKSVLIYKDQEVGGFSSRFGGDKARESSMERVEILSLFDEYPEYVTFYARSELTVESVSEGNSDSLIGQSTTILSNPVRVYFRK